MLSGPGGRSPASASTRRKEGEAITKEADAMMAALPRVTAADLKSLTANNEEPS